MASDIGQNVQLILNRSVLNERLPEAMREFTQKTEMDDDPKRFDITDMFVAIGKDSQAMNDRLDILDRPWWKKLLGLGRQPDPS